MPKILEILFNSIQKYLQLKMNDIIELYFPMLLFIMLQTCKLNNNSVCSASKRKRINRVVSTIN